MDTEVSQITVQCAVSHKNTKYTELVRHK